MGADGFKEILAILRSKGGGGGGKQGQQEGLKWKCFGCQRQNEGIGNCSGCKKAVPDHIFARFERDHKKEAGKSKGGTKGGGKGGPSTPSGNGKAGDNGAGGKGPQQPAAAAAVPKAEPEPESQMAKEFAKMLAWCTQTGYAGAGAAAAVVAGTSAGSEGDPNAKQKSAMDVLRADIAALQAVSAKSAAVLGEIAEKEQALERLRLEVRKSHPADVQLRNLDAKLAGVSKQREKHDEVADALAKEIGKLKASMDEAAAAGAARRKEEEQLRRERLALVQQLEAEKVKQAKAVAGEQPETAEDVAAKLEYDEILRQFTGADELKERLRVIHFGRKEPAAAAAASTNGSSTTAVAEATPPAAAAPSGTVAAGSGGAQSAVDMAKEAADAAAKRLADKDDGDGANMVDVGEGKDGEQDRVRQRTA